MAKGTGLPCRLKQEESCAVDAALERAARPLSKYLCELENGQLNNTE